MTGHGKLPHHLLAFNDVTLNKLKQEESIPEANPHWRNMSASVINSLKLFCSQKRSSKNILLRKLIRH